MPSPFPGMNPFLEQKGAWRDFHGRFLPAIATHLSAQIVPDYFVKIEEYLYIRDEPDEDRRFFAQADVAIGLDAPAGTAGGAVGVIDTPVVVTLPGLERERINFLRIYDRASREVIAVIELLSPTNKRPGKNRETYLAKRRRHFLSPAHFVEIDLLRGDPPMPGTASPRRDYAVMVSRAETRPEAALWPFRLRDPLPVVPIPLRPPTPDARLDLRAVLDRVYDEAFYMYFIYQEVPFPPLSPEDAAWAAGFAARPAPPVPGADG